jgi:shikimate kinase
MRSEGDLTIDCTETPDQLMNLAVRAAARHGTTNFVGAANLRHKECDRLAVLTEQLGRVGVAIEEHDDGVTVRGPSYLRTSGSGPVRLDPHRDHRMAMAFAVLGTMLQQDSGSVEILDPRCVAKSYPDFFRDFETVLATPRCLALVGMRGAGKSTLGRALALEMKRPFIDTDEAFVHDHGDIGDFVAARGWREFRLIEQDLVDQALVAGNIVALGGGAVTSATVRERLAENAFTVWIEAGREELARRIEGDLRHRPSLTDHPGGALGELPAVLEERLPLYREVASTTLSSSLPIAAQVTAVCEALRHACSW